MEWDRLVSGHGGGLQQAWGYGRASGRDCRRLELREGTGELLGLVQVLTRPLAFGWGLALISRGPVWLRGPEAQPDLRGLFRRHIVIRTSEDDRARGFRLAAPTTIAEVDLTPDSPALRARLHQKWRNRLGAAQRSGVAVREARDLDWILSREAENRARLRYAGLPDAFLRGYCEDPLAWRMFQARAGGRALAGGLFLLHGTCATYQIGWSGPEGRRLNAQNLVLWSAFERLKAAGVARVELGGIDAGRAPGLARFKLGAGARVRPLGPTVLVARAGQDAPFPRRASVR